MLGDLDPADFLGQHWQKRPLLVRDALPGFSPPISPPDLAALACCEGVDARIVLESAGSRPWELRTGPFDESDFAGLPERGWILLVQEVDRHVPEVAGLWKPLRFFPNWRLDDVMVSYAAPSGSVGPHVDNYDVFLLQGCGRRRWRFETAPRGESDERLVADAEVRVLATFEPDEEHVLEPGDVLYLPPRLAHEGVAIEAGSSFSLGFRAPSRRELLAAVLSGLLEDDGGDTRYGDPGLRPTTDPGRISTEVLDWAACELAGLAEDRGRLEGWLGTLLTGTRCDRAPGDARAVGGPELARALQGGARLHRVSPSLMGWLRRSCGEVSLFAAGREHRLAGDLEDAARLVSGTGPLERATLGNDPRLWSVLARLVEDGALRLECAGDRGVEESVSEEET